MAEGWVSWVRVLFDGKKTKGWTVWASHRRYDVLLERLTKYCTVHNQDGVGVDCISGVILAKGIPPDGEISTIKPGEFPTPAVGKLFAAALNARNFIVPRMRGVTLESAYYPGLQHRELVASQRLGMDSIITSGTSCVTYKYKAS